MLNKTFLLKTIIFILETMDPFFSLIGFNNKNEKKIPLSLK